jgi:hypothetical protein
MFIAQNFPFINQGQRLDDHVARDVRARAIECSTTKVTEAECLATCRANAVTSLRTTDLHDGMGTVHGAQLVHHTSFASITTAKIRNDKQLLCHNTLP